MKPEEKNDGQYQKQILPQKTVSLNPISDEHWEKEKHNREMAASVIRNQIDNIIDNQSTHSTQNTNENPYFRNHKEHVEPEAEKWQKYHSAWQNYYQKYYEGYYVNHLKNAEEKLKEKYKDQVIRKLPTQEEEMFDLRQKLVSKVRKSANQVKKSRHFMPIIAGILAVLIFLFLQYNQLIISNVMAYISPGNIDSQNIIVDPNSEIAVAPEPRLIIPKINVDVPVIYGIGSDYDSQMTAMTNGVAHFAISGADARPGELGNTVLAGHSSNSLFEDGKYKFIFVQLEKLKVGDIIYANYNSIRYTYEVTKTEVVKPTDVNALIYETSVPVLTLITCTPLGTDTNRLLVTAEQISPDPSKAIASNNNESSPEMTFIPGDKPSFLERLFGSSGN